MSERSVGVASVSRGRTLFLFGSFAESAKYLTPLLAVALLLVPMMADGLMLSRVEISFVYLVGAMSLNFAYGFAGQLALGEPILLAAGAYTAGLMSVYWQSSAVLTLPIAAVVGAVVSLILGLPSFRIRGWYFAVLTFFGIGVVPQLVATFQDVTGGLDGLVVTEPFSFGSYQAPAWVIYEATAGITILSYVLYRNAVKSGFGSALALLRDHPVAARSSGLNLALLKARVYVMIGIPCGLAGALLTGSSGVITPGNFDFNMILVFLGAVFLGGSGRLWGPIIGICFFQGISLWIGSFSRYNPLILGLGVLISAVLFRGGILPMIERFARTKRGVPKGDTSVGLRGGDFSQSDRLPRVRGSLKIEGLGVEFSGTSVLSGVSLNVESGKIVSVIGPNGSGKTTLLNAICGFAKPNAGAVFVNGRRIDHASPEARARAGLGRTFQTPRLVEELSVLDNVALGRYGRSPVRGAAAVLRLPSERRRSRAFLDEARWACALVGLGANASTLRVESLPLGLKRITEVARAVASGSSVLCLDEPAAGLNESERDVLASTLRVLADCGVAILLIEHNLDFVRDLSDEICLLSGGSIVERSSASGSGELSTGLMEFFGRFATPR